MAVDDVVEEVEHTIGDGNEEVEHVAHYELDGAL